MTNPNAPSETGEREAFEKWMVENLNYGYDLERDESGEGYSHDATDTAWLTWQARAALPTNAAGGEVFAFRSSRDGEIVRSDHLWCHDNPVKFDQQLGVISQPADEALPKDLTDEQIDALMPAVPKFDHEIRSHSHWDEFICGFDEDTLRDYAREAVRSALKQRLGSLS